MRYCYQCHRITAGKPLFCNYCGRSYDVKLCPRLHPNPRTAEVCSECGSRDLSTPEPRMPVWVKLSVLFLRYVPGVLLLVVSVVFLVAFIQVVLTSEELLGQFLVLALLLGIAWWIYTQLPAFMRHGIGKAMRGRKRKGSDHR